MPFTGDDDAPWWVRAGLPDPCLSEVLLDVPVELLEDVPVVLDPPVECGCCVEPEPATFTMHRVPDALVDRFTAEWGLVQQHTARMWRAVAAMHHAAGPGRAEFVGDDVALLTRMHPRTGAGLVLTAVQACAVAGLAELVETAQLSGKHVEALLDEVGRWSGDAAERQAVLQLTLDRTRAWVDRHGCWPTPGELRRRVRTAAVLRDLSAAEQRKRTVVERRGVVLSQSGVGAAVLSIEGPDVMVVRMMDGIRARAEAMAAVPGETRSLQQRMFDAANELLLVDADGGESSVPTVDDHGVPVTIRVRGVEVSVLVPYSVLSGGDLELAEIPGFGAVLPSTARELAGQAEHLRRVAVDADTGQVLAVDDRLPGPARTPASGAGEAVPHQAAPSQTPSGTPSAVAADLISDEDLPEAAFWTVEPPEDLDWSAEDDADNDGRPDDDPDDSGDPLGPKNDDPGGGPGGEPGGDPGGDDAGSPGSHGAVPGERDEDDAGELGAPGGADRTEPAAPPPLIEPEVGTDEPVALDPLPCPSGLNPAWLATMLHRLATEPVVHRDLRSSSYRVNCRIRRFIELRDRTCTFPGCTVPGRWCDADHREPWPLGPTDRENCHCVCRRHHRAKQAYFTVTLDTDTGDTLWTTPDRRTYRSPPPTF